MDRNAQVYRTDESLKQAEQDIAALKQRYAQVAVTDKGKRYNSDLLEAVELGFLLDLAEVLVVGARARNESRGGHFREDYPNRDDVNFMRHTMAYRDERRRDPAGLQAGRHDPLPTDGAKVLMTATTEAHPLPAAGAPAAAPPTRTITVKIRRFNPEIDTEPHWESYSVPALPTDRVLNLLHHIKWEIDGSLTFRRSCAHGVCGSDAMRINGVNRLACKVLVRDMPDEIMIEPIKGLPLEKDLVVDMEPFFEAYRAVKPFLITYGNQPLAGAQAVTGRPRALRRHHQVHPVRRLHLVVPRVLDRRFVLRPGRDRQRPPVHLRQPRPRRRGAARDPERPRRRLALPDDVQLHRGLPARHRDHQGHLRGQAGVAVPSRLSRSPRRCTGAGGLRQSTVRAVRRQLAAGAVAGLLFALTMPAVTVPAAASALSVPVPPPAPSPTAGGKSPDSPDPSPPRGGIGPDGQPVGGAALLSRSLIVPPGSPALPPGLTAQGWVLVDLDSGAILAARDPHGRYQPASILKTLTADTLLPLLPGDRTVTVSTRAATTEGSAAGLVAGGTYTIDELFSGLLLVSGNDTAEALADTQGGDAPTVALMNRTALTMGAYDTFVQTPSGLDGWQQLTSAYDMAVFLRAAVSDPRFVAYDRQATATLPWQRINGYGPVTLSNQNEQFLTTVPGALVAKTGYTDAAQHTFIGAISRGGRRLGVVFMRAQRYPTDQWQQATALMDWGFALPAGHRTGGTPGAGDHEC